MFSPFKCRVHSRIESRKNGRKNENIFHNIAVDGKKCINKRKMEKISNSLFIT